jgi:hypothetical protein
MWPFSGIYALLDIRTSMHFIFEPLDFIAKLASLVPKPKVNPGFMACSSECRTIPTATPNSSHTSQAGQKRAKSQCSGQNASWAPHSHDLGSAVKKECLPTVVALGDIDVKICSRCGGAVKVIADTSDRCIEDQQVIDKILFHLNKKDELPLPPDALPEARPPPHQQ